MPTRTKPTMRIREFGSDEWTRWITTWVAVATALFTVISFAYKELIEPNTAPVNIALDMSIDPKADKPLQVSQKDLDLTNKSGQYAAVYIRVKVTNASNKTLIFSKPYWLAFGRHKPPQTSAETSGTFIVPLKMIKTFNEFYGDPFTNDIPRLEVEKNSYDTRRGPSGEGLSVNDRNLLKENTRELIAAGELVAQREIKPGETFETQRVVFVNNESGYDFLETRVYLPSLIERNYTQINDVSFYAFLQNPNGSPWNWKTIKDKPSSRDDTLAVVWLVNLWCERPVSQRFQKSFTFKPLEFINFLQLNTLNTQSSDRQDSTQQPFCPSKSDSTKSPLQAGTAILGDAMREAGIQYFTATSEVLLLK